MRTIVAFAIGACIFLPAISSAQTCPDMSSVTIDAGAAGSAKCLSATTKASSKFISSKLKTQDKCRKARVPGACTDITPASFDNDDPPVDGIIRRDQKTTDKLIKALSKAGDGITKKCDGAAVAGLANSYAGTDPATLASCMLGQNSASASLMSWNNNGASAPWPDLGSCVGGARAGATCADDSACDDACAGGDNDGTACLDDLACTGGGACSDAGTCDDSKGPRTKCVDKFASGATKMASSILKSINKCVDKAIKGGTTTGLEAVCVGSFAGGVYVPGSDTKTGDKIKKAMDKAVDGTTKSCGALSAPELESIFACPGATTIADLENCAVCTNFAHILDILEQQYSEGGTFVAHAGGVGELQAAWDSATTDGEKFLVGTGTYTSDPLDVGLDDPVISITQTGTCNGGDTPGATCSNLGDCPGAAISCDGASPAGVQFVGCMETATGQRPILAPDAAPNSHSNGVFAANVDGLVFQGLEVFNWEGNGIFVTDAEGVTYRDIYGDGGPNLSTYAVFPVSSDDVLVEGCFVTRVDDAGVYVGSSTNYTVRYNMVTDSVAGMEIENSINADTHNNESYGNTGGILIFMLVGPPLQESHGHDTHHNVIVGNNTPNFGTGTVGAVPDGSGTFVVATDDSLLHHNYYADNNSYGLAIIDQAILSVISGDPGDCCSPSSDTVDNNYYDNVFVNNGASLDPDLVGIVQPNTQVIQLLAIAPGVHDNCYERNAYVLPLAALATDAETYSPDNDCTP